MKLYKAKKEDFQTVFKILEESSRWLLSKGNRQWPAEWIQRKKPEIEHAVASGLFSCVTINDEVVAVVELLSAPEKIWKYDDSKAMYIHKLAVSRKYAGKGVGKSLLEEIAKTEFSKGVKALRLDCVAENKGLRRYYESFGFIFKGIAFNGEIDLALFEYQAKS